VMANVLPGGEITVRPAAPGKWERLVRPVAPIVEMLRRDRFALTGVIIYAVIAFVAIFAPVLAPHDPHEVMEKDGIWLTNEKPSREFLLGTTNIGRDIFSQLIYGARPALLVGFTAAFFVVFIGTLVGLIAGYFGGWTDSVLMRITDVAFGIPFLPFVIVLVAFLRPSIWNIVLSMAILLWCDTARVIRSQVLTLRQRSYVQAAKVAGASSWRN